MRKGYANIAEGQDNKQQPRQTVKKYRRNFGPPLWPFSPMDKNHHKYGKKTDACTPLKEFDFPIAIAYVWYHN